MSAPLLVLPGSNGNPSASQRREMRLRQANEHLMATVAVLVAQQGGTAIVPAESLRHDWTLTWELSETTGDIVYTAVPKITVEAKVGP